MRWTATRCRCGMGPGRRGGPFSLAWPTGGTCGSLRPTWWRWALTPGVPSPWTATEVLVLTSSTDDEHLLSAVRAGALAYLPKTAGVDQVVASVRAPAHGESVLEPRIAARLVRSARRPSRRTCPASWPSWGWPTAPGRPSSASSNGSSPSTRHSTNRSDGAPPGLAGRPARCPPRWASPARSLSASVEAEPVLEPAPSDQAQAARTPGRRHAPLRTGPLRRSRPAVLRLAGLFAVDALGGGFVVQAFIAYWLAARFGASAATLGLVFFGVGLLQTGSFLVATRLAERIGLLATMVFTHLPSNLLLAAIAFAPSLPVAVGLLFARQALSQMDVPTRQAYVMALVDPAERTAAAAWTNTARYLARPAGPALAGVAGQLALGAPFVVAGAVKAAYDLVLWAWFHRVELPDHGDDPVSRHRPHAGVRAAVPPAAGGTDARGDARTRRSGA